MEYNMNETADMNITDNQTKRRIVKPAITLDEAIAKFEDNKIMSFMVDGGNKKKSVFRAIFVNVNGTYTAMAVDNVGQPYHNADYNSILSNVKLLNTYVMVKVTVL